MCFSYQCDSVTFVCLVAGNTLLYFAFFAILFIALYMATESERGRLQRPRILRSLHPHTHPSTSTITSTCVSENCLEAQQFRLVPAIIIHSYLAWPGIRIIVYSYIHLVIGVFPVAQNEMRTQINS